MGDEEDQIQPDSGQSNGSNTHKVGLRERIKHFTWANFTCTQSTGGVAIVLSATPYQFSGQQTAGTVIFIFNIVVFILFCTAMVTRFVLHPQMIKRSLQNPPETFFLGSFWVSFAVIIIGIQRFGVPHTGYWLVVVVRVLFWMYAACTLTYTITMFVVGFAKVPIQPDQLNPAYLLKIYNAMLTGTVASNIAASQPPSQRLPIIVAGVAYQGLGWTVSILILAWLLGGLMRNGLGPPNQRPGLFMMAGAGGYTIVALLGCAMSLPAGYGYFALHPNAVEILQVMALWVSIFIWLFTFWTFALALLASLPTALPKVGKKSFQPRMEFRLSWWAFIFPNVGWTIGTGDIGTALDSPAVKWVGTSMAIVLFAVWLFDLGLHLKAILTGQIMWPGKDEDATK